MDAITISTYKVGGPVGVAMLVMKPEVEIVFMQKSSPSNPRGGALNMGVISACKSFIDGTSSQLAKLRMNSFAQRSAIIAKFKEKFNVVYYNDLVINLKTSGSLAMIQKDTEAPLVPDVVNVIIFGFNTPEMQIPNTLMAAFIKYNGDYLAPYCKIRVKEELEKRGITVGIGAACDSGTTMVSAG